ncbi:hypothetical protein VN0963_11490 [Helicobacter pylori]
MDTICLKEGQEVVVFGGISAYVPRGDYQINCFEIEPKDRFINPSFRAIERKITP